MFVLVCVRDPFYDYVCVCRGMGIFLGFVVSNRRELHAGNSSEDPWCGRFLSEGIISDRRLDPAPETVSRSSKCVVWVVYSPETAIPFEGSWTL